MSGAASAQTTQAAGGRIPATVWRVAAVIACGALMSQLDASVANVGLATIARRLHGTLADAQWVANGYVLALAVSLPACGWLARRLGSGRVWLASLAAFTACSSLCALAPSLGWLILLRVLQGLTAGILVPAGQTVIGHAAGPQRLGRVMATLGIVVGLGPTLGPVIGAIVINLGGWPYLFLLNVPLGILTLAAGARFVPRGTSTDRDRLDVGGLALISAGLPLVVYAVTTIGEQHGVSAQATVTLLAGAGALGTFWRHSRRRSHPLLDLTLFADRRYRAALTTAAFTGAALFGAAILFPLFFQLGRHQGVLSTGLSLISMGIGTAILAPVSGRLIDRLGSGTVATAGGIASLITTLPFAVMHVQADGAIVQLLLLTRGMAVALAAVPAGVAAYKTVTPEQLPDAATQVNILQRLGGAAGGAIFTIVLATNLPSGSDGAFHAAFWALSIASAAGLLSALWLARCEAGPRRRDRPSPAAVSGH